MNIIGDFGYREKYLWWLLCVTDGAVGGDLVGLCVGISCMVSECPVFLSVNYMLPWSYAYFFKK